MSEDAKRVSNDRKIWLGLILGIAVWFLHLNVVNSLNSFACEWKWFPFTIAGITGLRFVHIVISLIAAVLIIGVIVFAWREWRPALDQRDDALTRTSADRHLLIAFVTLLLNTGFLIYTLASLVMIVSLNPCV